MQLCEHLGQSVGELQSKDCPLRNPELERNGSAFKPIQKNSVVSWEQPRENLANAEVNSEG